MRAISHDPAARQPVARHRMALSGKGQHPPTTMRSHAIQRKNSLRFRADPKTLRVARATIHHRQRTCSSVKYTQYCPLLAHPLAARLVALARSEVFGPALSRLISRYAMTTTYAHPERPLALLLQSQPIALRTSWFKVHPVPLQTSLHDIMAYVHCTPLPKKP